MSISDPVESRRSRSRRADDRTWVTSAPVAAKTAVFSSAPVPAVRGLAVSMVTRSARLADRDPADAPRRCRCRAARRRSSARARGWPAVRASPGRAAPRTGRSRRGCRCRGSAGSPASCSAWPGRCRRQVALGGRAEADVVPVAPSSAMSSSVRWVACTTVVPGPSRPSSCEQPRSGYAVRREAVLVLARLLGQVDVQRVRARGTTCELVARHRPHRVDRGAATSRRRAPRSAQRSASPSQ